MSRQYRLLHNCVHAAVRYAAASAFALALAAGVAIGQPPAKQKQPGTVGTDQVKGGDGLIGTTYSFKMGGPLLNATLTRAEYTVTRFNVGPGSCVVPKVGEKLLILHWQVKNPNKDDEYISRNVIPFSTVAADGQTRNHGDYQRLAKAKEPIGLMMKPGQGPGDELLAVALVPAAGAVPKLIVNFGRFGTSDKVTRYNLGSKPNIVAGLPAGDADPADKSGATALELVPAKPGVTYALGYFDFTINSITFADGPFGALKPANGKRFLVISVTVANRAWSHVYASGLIDATLLTADDEKTKMFHMLKGKRDEPAEGVMVEPEDTVTYRMVFDVPKDTTGKKLTMAEIVDNTNHKSRSLVFDLSDIK